MNEFIVFAHSLAANTTLWQWIWFGAGGAFNKHCIEYKNNKLYKRSGRAQKKTNEKKRKQHQTQCNGIAMIVCTKHSRGSVQQPIGKKCEMNSWFGKQTYHP